MQSILALLCICVAAIAGNDIPPEGPDGHRMVVHFKNGVEPVVAGSEVVDTEWPNIMIIILLRNKAHVLPYFLNYLYDLDYPKGRIHLWIRGDHSKDDSYSIMEEWALRVRSEYMYTDFQYNDETTDYDGQKADCEWQLARMTNVIQLKDEGLKLARENKYQYAFVLDADALLLNPDTLKTLIRLKLPVVAPMLNNTGLNSEFFPDLSSVYSNFWGAMNKQTYYYERSEDYVDIQQRRIQGVLKVPVVHSAILLDLEHPVPEQGELGFYPPPPGYYGPRDDVVIFAKRNLFYGHPVHLVNEDFYGFIPVPQEYDLSLEDEQFDFQRFVLEKIVYGPELQKSPHLKNPESRLPPKDTLGFDQVYMINLVRRPDRREQMLKSFDELGISAHVIDAVDGRLLNQSWLKENNIQQLEGYYDPHQNRDLKMGEIGCFMSHYLWWQDMVDNGHQTALVFEDDVRFERDFRGQLEKVMADIKRIELDWDILYLGRKRLNTNGEFWVEGSSLLSWPTYTYWTLSYALTLRGAQKLLAQEPLTKMVPVDEYLPIMFGQHPNEEWSSAFSPRDLVTISAEPLLCHPTHYTGDPGYVTDTEDSTLITIDEEHQELDSGAEETAEPQETINEPMLAHGGEL